MEEGMSKYSANTGEPGSSENYCWWQLWVMQDGSGNRTSCSVGMYVFFMVLGGDPLAVLSGEAML